MQRREVKSAVRTFEVLELFAERRSPLHLHEIYTALGYPQSSTSNLLKSMVVMGYLNFNRVTRTYLPTLRINALGAWIPGFVQSERSYREMAWELQRRTDETVALATQNDLYIQYLFIAEPSHEFKEVPSAGAMRVLANSAAGQAILSMLPDRAIDKLCRYTNHYELCNPRIDIPGLLKEIAWIRRVGYAYAISVQQPHLAGVAFPLDSKLHGVPLAIGVGGLADRIKRNKMEIVAIAREVIAKYGVANPAPESGKIGLQDISVGDGVVSASPGVAHTPTV